MVIRSFSIGWQMVGIIGSTLRFWKTKKEHFWITLTVFQRRHCIFLKSYIRIPLESLGGQKALDWAPILAESATWLEHPSTEEEILKAIFQLDKDKAPGPDGFTLLFRSVHSLSVLRIFHPSCFCLLSSSSSLFIFLIH